MIRTIKWALVTLAAFAFPVAGLAAPSIGNLAVVCVGDDAAAFRPHLRIDDGAVIDYRHLRCGAVRGGEPTFQLILINLDVQISGVHGRGAQVRFSLDGRWLAGREGAQPWRMFGDTGQRNHGAYVWDPRQYTVEVELSWNHHRAEITPKPSLTRSWAFTIEADGTQPGAWPGPPTDEEIFEEMLDITLRYQPLVEEKVKLLRATKGLSASKVKQILIDKIDEHCYGGCDSE